MRVIAWSRDLQWDVAGWIVTTNQANAVVFEDGEDGPYCKVMF